MTQKCISISSVQKQNFLLGIKPILESKPQNKEWHPNTSSMEAKANHRGDYPVHRLQKLFERNVRPLNFQQARKTDLCKRCTALKKKGGEVYRKELGFLPRAVCSDQRA